MSAQDSPGMSAGGSGAGPSSAKKPAKPAGGRGRGGRGRGRGRGRSGTVGPAGKGKAPADGAGEGAGEDGKNPESEVDQKKRKRGLLNETVSVADGAGEGAGEDGKNPESEVDQKKRKRGLLTRDRECRSTRGHPTSALESSFALLLFVLAWHNSTPSIWRLLTDASTFPAHTVKHMMYGFGDVQEPDKETVDLVEDMTLDYVTNFAHRCMEVSARRGKLQTEDLLYLIRNDEKKVQRVNELLDMNMQLKEARKNFSTDEAAIDPAK
eukprot:CAMPEP_0119223520 /NCGR_PEP_ID=MMETSP1327-20130426/33201_1 /TAXON_ID=38833 /ORGANISM="Micromonas pusilla, Strain RCC2306" /LENGTH=266 /DNA_ID=CAMNT_0007221795 /DNA_START=863 /DNA_END=1665 /DNA_ORIENTATION=-